MKTLARLCPLLVLALLLPATAGPGGDYVLEIAGHRTPRGAAPATTWEGPLISTTRFGRGDRDWVAEPFRLAVILVEFADAKRDSRVTLEDYERMFFGINTFHGRRPTGGPANGSLTDYWLEQSYGQFTLTGRVFDWVTLEQERSFFEASGQRAAQRQAFVVGAAEQLIEREGNPDLFRDFDGLTYMPAGNRAVRGSLLWGHRASTTIRGQSFNYYMKGTETDTIGVHAHEFGHMLSLPDKYGSSGSGLGVWCTMATGHGSGPRPRHVCAWCKTRSGWLDPVVVDPRVPQRLVLRPVYTGPREAFIIPVNESGEEFFLLENRQQLGFDTPIDPGLLIWHLGEEGRRQQNSIRAVDIHLHPAHGREQQGSRNPVQVDRENVPWPREGKTEFTPETTPSSRTKGENDFPVHIRNIRQEDGMLFFELGPAAAFAEPPALLSPRAGF